MHRVIAIVGNGTHGRMLGLFITEGGRKVQYFQPIWEVEADMDVCIGVGNKALVGDSGLAQRRELYEKYDGRIVGLHHATSFTYASTIDSTAQILPFAIINPRVVIKENVILNTGCVVEHDCFVGAHSHIAPRAVLCGAVRVGEETHIGAGAVVLQGIKIGSRCVIGAGAVVTKNVDDGNTVFGNPASERRPVLARMRGTDFANALEEAARISGVRIPGLGRAASE